MRKAPLYKIQLASSVLQDARAMLAEPEWPATVSPLDHCLSPHQLSRGLNDLVLARNLLGTGPLKGPRIEAAWMDTAASYYEVHRLFRQRLSEIPVLELPI